MSDEQEMRELAAPLRALPGKRRPPEFRERVQRALQGSAEERAAGPQQAGGRRWRYASLAGVLILVLVALPCALHWNVKPPAKTTAGTAVKVGPFTVRTVQVPNALANGSGAVQVGPNTIVRVSDAPPYIVQRRTFPDGRWTRVTVLHCARGLILADIYGPGTGYLCLGPAGTKLQHNQLILFGADGRPTAYALPVRLPTSLEGVEVWGYVLGGTRGTLTWFAMKSPPVGRGRVLSSGVINLASGREATNPAPSTLRPDPTGIMAAPSGRFYLSPSDSLFVVGSGGSHGAKVEVYSWSGSEAKLRVLGKVAPPYETLGVGDDGTVWAARPASSADGSQPSSYFVREVPGSGRMQSWKIDGNILGGGPGYVIYSPASDAASVDIFFPLQHRTLYYRGFNDPGQMQYLAALWQIDPAMHVVMTGKGTKTLEIQISQ